MATHLLLPSADGTLQPYTPEIGYTFPDVNKPARSRIAYAAAHVVCDPLADNIGGIHIDWEATLAYRRYLWSLGLGVAEAMDTAQRGMGLDWQTSKELIRRSLAESRTQDEARIVCGAGTDQLVLTHELTLSDVVAAYLEQCSFVEQAGGRIVLMASRALAACARTPDDYLTVYDSILAQVKHPVIIHWLGEMFDPALAGYWGYTDHDQAMHVCLECIRTHVDKVDGIKVSLLSAEREVTMRRLLPAGVRMFTGDDFNYPALIRGDGALCSDALLGIFDAIAPAAAEALQCLDKGDLQHYDAIFAPTAALSRHIFQAPTYYYKTGIVFMAYLNGHQAHFHMVAGMENARSVVHLAELFKLADQAGLLRDPEMATERMQRVLAIAGIV
jgi:hypothetical protein